ncbi:glycoside hydrolase family 43 protein [Pedobacter rhodius]|uniref:Family 43 glycosylhydrolase n=1 Tax=Pedobacter rhodius TaxID=3004098 RepID=A0ABT4KTE6_9SPHI|nr:glycoside hydrolase 43 family protein [Pedobacter sp. SJ11]MCZ4222180.1 family 43 glycosylhydrolase [Pedobacter sp. SJ11]
MNPNNFSQRYFIIFLSVFWSVNLFAQVSGNLNKNYKKTKKHNLSKRYSNPILPGDFQNTDVIRVGTKYYYISATKELSPGMMIMSSQNLVNWKIIGHAVADITQINPRYNYDIMEGQSRGIWAGAIRYYNKKFYVYFTDPDEGLFVTTAEHPAGPWAPLKILKKGPGWDDPCPLWDDNGKAYLAMTNFADNYKIYLFRLSQDGKVLTDSGKIIHQSEGSEANKLYKINGYYYHFYSEVTKEGRIPFMARAKNIYGPYQERRQLIHKAKAEPNQGGMINTPDGKWYFVTHHGQSYWSGREASLLPVTWIDGWPVWGNAGRDGIGNMVWSGITPDGKTDRLQTSDEFNQKVIAPQWEWYFQPDDKKWSLKERPGFLRMYSSKPLFKTGPDKIPNVLTQRPLRKKHNTVVLKLDIHNMANGQIAGLTLFGKTYAFIGISQNHNKRVFILTILAKLM